MRHNRLRALLDAGALSTGAGHLLRWPALAERVGDGLMGEASEARQ
ncbi:MAG: hypothetical protein U1E21_00450 [Reyranellaceae bacterium]